MTRICLRIFAALAVVLLLNACQTTKVISEWDAGRDNIDKRERIAVVAMMPESLQRLTVEQELVEGDAQVRQKRTGVKRCSRLVRTSDQKYC